MRTMALALLKPYFQGRTMRSGAPAFDVRPVEHGAALSRHLVGIEQSGKLHELCFALRVDALDEFAQRKTYPGYDNGPAFFAAVPVNGFFGWGHFDDGVHVEFLFFVDQPVDLYFPRPGAEILGQVCRFFFLRGKFVVVVVVSDVLFGSNRLRSAERAFLDAVNLVAGLRYSRGIDALPQTRACCDADPRH